MAGTFFTDFLPAITGELGKLPAAGYQGKIQGMQLAKQMELEEARVQQLKALAKHYPQMEALRQLAYGMQGQALEERIRHQQEMEGMTRQRHEEQLAGQAGRHQEQMGLALTLQGMRTQQAKELEASKEKARASLEKGKVKPPTLLEANLAEYDKLPEGQKQAWRQRHPMMWRMIEAELKKKERGASQEPTTTVKPDFMGKPQVSRTYKGVQAKEFNEAYGAYKAFLQGLKEPGMFGGGPSRVQQAQAKLKELEANPSFDAIERDAWSQAYTESFGSAR